MATDQTTDQRPRLGLMGGPVSKPALLLLLVLATMAATDRWFTLQDDEVWILMAAAQPVRQTLELFRSGQGQHEHPPLSDLLLHAWIVATGTRLNWLRFPAELLYIAGIWTLAKTARRTAGDAGFRSMIWMGALWPYGFHYGRLFGWYLFAFFLVALLIESYERFRDTLCFRDWLVMFVTALALVATNYFGWAVVACLAFDLTLRWPGRRALIGPRLAGTLALLAMIYTPLWITFLRTVRAAPGFGVAPDRLARAGAVLYTLFTSEAVAPWVWFLSVPCIIATIVATIVSVMPALPYSIAAWRFAAYFVLLFAGLTILGETTGKHVILITPFLLLAVVSGAATPPKRRRVWLLALMLIALISWWGILSRRYYAVSRWFEPWPEVARQSAEAVRRGATVIGNNLVFFLYLTHEMEQPNVFGRWNFSGILTRQVRHPLVFDAAKWQEQGQPTTQETLLVVGSTYLIDQVVQDQEWLDKHCRFQNSTMELPNPGFELKQRFLTPVTYIPWHTAIRHYVCVQDIAQKRNFTIPTYSKTVPRLDDLALVFSVQPGEGQMEINMHKDLRTPEDHHGGVP